MQALKDGLQNPDAKKGKKGKKGAPADASKGAAASDDEVDSDDDSQDSDVDDMDFDAELPDDFEIEEDAES